ncbi:MAG: endolytic transglycosylase MltG [Lactovum sp.]
MSDKFSRDNFLNEDPNEKNVLSSESGNFSNFAGEIPEDVQRLAQQVMDGQNRNQLSNSIKFGQEGNTFENQANEEDYPNSLKVSNIRFMGFRPEKPAVANNLESLFLNKEEDFQGEQRKNIPLNFKGLPGNVSSGQPAQAQSVQSIQPTQVQPVQPTQTQMLPPVQPTFNNSNSSFENPSFYSENSKELVNQNLRTDDFRNQTLPISDQANPFRYEEERTYSEHNFEADFSRERPSESIYQRLDIHQDASLETDLYPLSTQRPSAYEFISDESQFVAENQMVRPDFNSTPVDQEFLNQEESKSIKEPEESTPKVNRSERVKAEREALEQDKEKHKKSKKKNKQVKNRNREHTRDFDENRHSNKSHFGRNVVILLVITIFSLVVGGYFYVTNSLKAMDARDKSVRSIEIPTNTSIKGVSEILEEEGMIKNALIFNYYAQFSGNSKFKSGNFELSKSMSAEEIAKALQNATTTPASTGKITIPEGYTLEMISEAITINANDENSSPFTSEEFMSVVTDQEFISEMQTKYPELLASLPTTDSGVFYQLEGYLFPATYEYDSSTTVRSLIELMLEAMNQNMSPLYPQISEMGYDVNSFLSLAALVEKEANTEEDRQDVADVFIKRLNEGIILGSNVALLYLEGKLGTEVTMEEDANVDTSADSAFNLYLHQGTGPGPVVSPSLMSMEAVINHTANEYYYFIADPTTGEVYFAVTQEEHDANIAQYLSN